MGGSLAFVRLLSHCVNVSLSLLTVDWKRIYLPPCEPLFRTFYFPNRKQKWIFDFNPVFYGVKFYLLLINRSFYSNPIVNTKRKRMKSKMIRTANLHLKYFDGTILSASEGKRHGIILDLLGISVFHLVVRLLCITSHIRDVNRKRNCRIKVRQKIKPGKSVWKRYGDIVFHRRKWKQLCVANASKMWQSEGCDDSHIYLYDALETARPQ